jgi:hypothetical protein
MPGPPFGYGAKLQNLLGNAAGIFAGEPYDADAASSGWCRNGDYRVPYLQGYLRGPRERGGPPLPRPGGPSKPLRGGPSDRPAGNAARGGSGKLAMPAG